MSLTVLSDEEIRGLLESLTRDEAEALSFTLKCALHEYSTGTQFIEAGLVHQPNRTSIHSNITNATTLFMPSSSQLGHGVKGEFSRVPSPLALPPPGQRDHMLGKVGGML